MAKKTSRGKIAAEIGAGLVAAGAAATAGYYLYGSKNAKKHRKVAAKWANEVKKEVVREVQKQKIKVVKKIAKKVASKKRKSR